jgi:hypothetical protein
MGDQRGFAPVDFELWVPYGALQNRRLAPDIEVVNLIAGEQFCISAQARYAKSHRLGGASFLTMAPVHVSRSVSTRFLLNLNWLAAHRIGVTSSSGKTNIVRAKHGYSAPCVIGWKI